jgi:hypothetical protein
MGSAGEVLGQSALGECAFVIEPSVMQALRVGGATRIDFRTKGTKGRNLPQFVSHDRFKEGRPHETGMDLGLAGQRRAHRLLSSDPAFWSLVDVSGSESPNRLANLVGISGPLAKASQGHSRIFATM